MNDRFYVEHRHWPAKRGRPVPTLVVAVADLERALYEENAVVAEEDVPRLMAALLGRCRRADSEPGLLDELAARYEKDDDETE